MKKYIVVGWNICKMKDDVKVVFTTDDLSKSVFFAERIATRNHNPKGTMIVECESTEDFFNAFFIFPKQDDLGEYTTTSVPIDNTLWEVLNNENPSGEETKFYKQVAGIAMLKFYELVTMTE